MKTICILYLLVFLFSSAVSNCLSFSSVIYGSLKIKSLKKKYGSNN